jgi:hypothetical protein
VAPALERVLGPGVALVDSAPAIARRTAQLLDQAGQGRRDGAGGLRVLTTGDAEKVEPVVRRRMLSTQTLYMPNSAEQRKSVQLLAKVTDGQNTSNAEATVIVKKRAEQAKRLPDIIFVQGEARVNNCGKRVLLEELRPYTSANPGGKVVLVGHVAEKEPNPSGLDQKRALNAAAVISAGKEVCTAFPTSQIFVNAAGVADNEARLQPNFCGGSTAAAERPGQAVSANDAVAKYRRAEVWFVPAGGALPASGEGAKEAGALGVSRLGCPK